MSAQLIIRHTPPNVQLPHLPLVTMTTSLLSLQIHQQLKRVPCLFLLMPLPRQMLPYGQRMQSPIPVINKRKAHSPLKVALADGRKVFSTHECNVRIIGLPTVLTGHIIPDLSIASLFGIRVLTEAGCKVRFNKHKCTVWYDNKIILEGEKDSTTDL
jgi:hypothetical protein